MRTRQPTVTAQGLAALKRAFVGSAIMLAVWAGAEGRAYALQGGEDAASLPVLLDKRYGAGGKQKLSLMLTSAIITTLVQDTGLMATYQYSFNDLFGVELIGGYFLGTETSIGDAIRRQGIDPACTPDSSTSTCEPLGDLFQMQWLAGADVVFTPLYGKLSLASELNPSFELYLVAGVGAGGVRRKQSAVPDTNASSHDTAITAVGNLGLGIRIHVLDSLGLRVEYRSYIYPEQADGEGGVTWNPHVQVGAEFTFGGDQ